METVSLDQTIFLWGIPTMWLETPTLSGVMTTWFWDMAILFIATQRRLWDQISEGLDRSWYFLYNSCFLNFSFLIFCLIFSISSNMKYLSIIIKIDKRIYEESFKIWQFFFQKTKNGFQEPWKWVWFLEILNNRYFQLFNVFSTIIIDYFW